MEDEHLLKKKLNWKGGISALVMTALFIAVIGGMGGSVEDFFKARGEHEGLVKTDECTEILPREIRPNFDFFNRYTCEFVKDTAGTGKILGGNCFRFEYAESGRCKVALIYPVTAKGEK